MTNDLVHKMTPEEEKVEFERITNPEFMDKELRQVANETIAELQREVDLLNLRVEQLEREIYNLEMEQVQKEQRMDQIRELAW
jgi:predicted RNase H-like nuclease (RuvC/YqgF family)